MYEKIVMNKKRFGYYPQQFTRHGRHYDVCAIERCWTVSQRQGEVERLYFQVRCDCEGDRFRLFQDLNTGMWLSGAGTGNAGEGGGSEAGV
jgi:hypothetical protein